MNGRPSTALAGEVIERLAFLEAIDDDPPAPAGAVADRVDASVSTVNRVVSRFAEAGLARRTDDGIELTAAGSLALAEARRFTDAVDRTGQLQAVLESIDAAPVTSDLGWVLKATVTVAAPTHPYAPLQRYSELFAGAERKRLLGDRFVVPERGVEAAMEAMEAGTHCTCVWSDRAFERMAEAYPELVDWSAGRDDLEAAVAESVPLDMAIFDDHLLVYAFDDGGIMTAIVDTDDPDVLEWGEAVFEACLEGGEELALDP